MSKGKDTHSNKPRRGRPPCGATPSKEDLFSAYVEEGRSIREIGKALNCSKDMVARALKAYGIEARARIRKSRLEKLDRETLETAVKAKGVRGTALELGVNASTLSRFLRSKGER